MSRRFWIAGSIAMLASVSVGALWMTGAERVTPTSIEWQGELAAAHEISTELNRPMLIVCSAEWCQFCGKLERETLSRSSVTDYVASEFVPVRLDYDRDRDLAKVLEITSLPCSVVLSPEGDLLGRLVGYVEPQTYRDSLIAARRLQDRIRQVRVAAASAERRD